MGIIAGILLVLLSIAHTVYGEKKQIPGLREITHDSIMIGSLRVMIHQGGLLLFAVGIIQILVSLGSIELIGVARYILVGIIVLNLCVFLFVAVFVHRDLLKITIPQVVIFLLVIALQLLSL